MFMRARAQFMRELAAGIGRAARKAQREGLKLCVRLNGATDINWIATIKAYPDIQFVDYTKSEARALAHAQGKLPPNYHVTFSYAGDNAEACERVLAAGGNVAVCFYTGQRKRRLLSPQHGLERPVVDGDLSDLRHLDPKCVVSPYRPKERKAKRDGVKLGFVIDHT